eukprot:jgi/Picsp_1/795/NSC_04284-R1_protein
MNEAVNDIERCSIQDSPPNGYTASVPSYLVETEEQLGKVISLEDKCRQTTYECLGKLIERLEACASRLYQGDLDEDALEDVEKGVRKCVEDCNAVNLISKTTKALHGGVSKLGKNIDAHYTTDVCKGHLGGGLDDQKLDEVLFEHLYRSGNFEVGDTLAKEAAIDCVHEVRQRYTELCKIEKDLGEKRLEAALVWERVNEEILQQNIAHGSLLGFLLRRLSFLDILKKQGGYRAMMYARKYFEKYYWQYRREIEELMGFVAFHARLNSGRDDMETDKDDCPWHVMKRYSRFSGECEGLWEQVKSEFRRQFCYALGQPQDSPLLISVAAGAAVLPTLLKYAEVAAKTKSATQLTPDLKELPVELPLPDEFVYHSIFVCPVSKERSTKNDPPMLLPCGHCLNKSSISIIAKSANRKFKCPYCPEESTLADCQQLHFEAS